MAASGFGLWMALRRGPSLVGQAINEFTSTLLVGESLDGSDPKTNAHAALSDRTLRLFGIAMLVVPGLLTAAIGLALLVAPIRALLIPIAGSKVNSLFPNDLKDGLFGPSFRTILGGIDPTFRRGDVVDVSSVKKDSAEESTRDTPARPELN